MSYTHDVDKQLVLDIHICGNAYFMYANQLIE